jgi:hypothetical protein
MIQILRFVLLTSALVALTVPALAQNTATRVIGTVRDNQ